MPHTRTHTFGPGSMESLTLKTWVAKKEDKGNPDTRPPGIRPVYDYKYKATLKGRYTVYCGEGNEHDVVIDETESGWLHEFGGFGSAIMNAHENGVALDFVGDLINWSLEDWEDPCEVYEL